jgi:hypothetical protein
MFAACRTIIMSNELGRGGGVAVTTPAYRRVFGSRQP